MWWLTILWIITLIATFWWLTGLDAPLEATTPAGDPYADEVARFRREMHDWDRG